MQFERNPTPFLSAVAMGVALSVLPMAAASAQEKRPNIVMLMTDDTGWNDFGAYGGGANLGHPTPNIVSPKRELCSRAGMARRVAPRAAPHS
jgi:hypothetical protein